MKKIAIALFLCVLDMQLLIEAAGNDGTPQLVGVGMYCSSYFTAANVRATSISTESCLHCYPNTNRGLTCPWSCNVGGMCYSVLISYSYTTFKGDNQHYCLSGCVSTTPCTAKPNAYFTGNGTVGDPNSCPFACNSGYVKSGASCISITTAAVTTTTPAPTTQPPTTPTPSTPAGPNGYFTGVGTAGDNKSCPFECSVGYYKSQESYACVNQCPTGQYLLNGACVTCKTCDSGYWLSGCTGASAGMCSTCNN